MFITKFFERKTFQHISSHKFHLFHFAHAVLDYVDEKWTVHIKKNEYRPKWYSYGRHGYGFSRLVIFTMSHCLDIHNGTDNWNVNNNKWIVRDSLLYSKYNLECLIAIGKKKNHPGTCDFFKVSFSVMYSWVCNVPVSYTMTISIQWLK